VNTTLQNETDHAIPAFIPAPSDEEELEEGLSRPLPQTVETFRRLSGDLLILGASGKMGPSLARMARRAMDQAGSTARVLAAARFSDPASEAYLKDHGIETVRVDLLDPAAVNRLPDAENILFMAGQKFGTAGRPEQAWAMNTVVPVYVAERFAGARQVVFSTGCVYANHPAESAGSLETDPLEPVGDYANSCVGRERVFTHFAHRHHSPLAVYRLNYAVDLRYGVLVDIARKVLDHQPVDVTMGYANVLWQGDANDRALRCLEHAAVPPFVVNVTGPETLSVRALAHQFATLFGRETQITGTEAPDALLSDASRSIDLFGQPSVDTETLIHWVADWLLHGRRTLNKPTQFERFDGRY
jgi:dTDP-4-dehydrorhamnose reductase